MANNYYERGDRLNVYLADELPEDMTGKQDTQHICGKCAWYSFAKLESICRKTGKEVAYFANRECFTTDKDMDMEENNNAQPVAESTGTQVCKECGRTLPMEDFQRRRNGKRDKVCKACRAENIRVGIATGKKVKVDIPDKIAKAVTGAAQSDLDARVVEEMMKTEGVEIAQLCHYLVEFKIAGLALWGMMPTKKEDIDHMIEAEWMISFCQEIFVAAAELKRDGANVVPSLVAKRLGGVGQMFVKDLGNAFYPLMKECDTSEQNPAEWSEDYREEDIQTRFAFYTYKDDPSFLYLSNVFVEESSRNHGFGTRILRAAEEVAKTIGAITISLKVKQDSPANAWYRKNGYGYVAFEDGYDWLEKNLEYMKPNHNSLPITDGCNNDCDNWKPSEEQIEALEHFIRSWGEWARGQMMKKGNDTI